MLAAEDGDDASLDNIGTQGGQRPAAVGQSQLVGWRLRQGGDLLGLIGSNARGSAQWRVLIDRSQAVLAEGVQVGVDGVGMDVQGVGDVLGVHPGIVQEQCVDPTLSPWGLRLPFQFI